MKFWRNVLAVLDARNMSVRALAREIGITPGALSRYSRGSVPSLAVAARIAQRLGLSLDSLVWGDGVDDARPVCEAPEDHELLKVLVSEFALDEWLQLASLSSQSLAWDIVLKLAYHHPESVSLATLKEELEEDVDDGRLLVNLLALQKRGLVLATKDETGVTRYAVPRPSVDFDAREVGDVSQHVLRAVRVLFRKVVPGLVRQDGTAYLTSVSANVPKDVAASLANRLRDVVVEQSQEAIANTGTTMLHIVFAVDYDDPRCQDMQDTEPERR